VAHWEPHIVENFTSCRSEVYRIGRRDIGASLAAVVGRAVEGWNLDSSGKKPPRTNGGEIAS
jgi:hypothetical protein